jgi:hypothetical protein
MSHRIIYRLYPNNEVRATHCYVAPRTKLPARGILLWTQFVLLLCASDGEVLSEATPPLILDISEDFDKTGYGTMGKRTVFGLAARRTILRAGGALDRTDPEPGNYVFLTGTIPGDTHCAFAAMAAYSTWVVHRLSKWLNYHAKKGHWFYAWELQKRGALHIHWCVHIPDKDRRDYVLGSFKKFWSDLLDDLSVLAGVDMWDTGRGYSHASNKAVLQADAEVCRKSVAVYVSGYASDSGDKHKYDKNCPYYPSRWWGMARCTTKLLKELTEEVVVEHTNYRAANQEILRHREKALESTPLVNTYPHSVGPGRTVVSYHPDDRGEALWKTLRPMNHPPHLTPNTASMIQGLTLLLKTYPRLLRACRKSKAESCKRLLLDCEDSILLASLCRYTLNIRVFRVVENLVSELSLNSLGSLVTDETRNMLIASVWAMNQNRPHCQWDVHGYLKNESDLPYTVDNCWSMSQSSTTDSSDAQGADPALAEASSQDTAPTQLRLL